MSLKTASAVFKIKKNMPYHARSTTHLNYLGKTIIKHNYLYFNMNLMTSLKQDHSLLCSASKGIVDKSKTTTRTMEKHYSTVGGEEGEGIMLNYLKRKDKEKRAPTKRQGP